MRLIDADVLKQHIDKLPALPDGNFAGNHSALKALINMQPTIQTVATDTNVGDTISKFIDGLEEIFADLREKHVDDSVCGLCEYDGAYIGQSGDWCNECPGFERDDCFKLSDETRKKWTDEIIKALSTIQPEQMEGEWVPVHPLQSDDPGAYMCSKCKTGMWEIRPSSYHYCPNCGAKMKGAEHETN
jgi:hypothetical protein